MGSLKMGRRISRPFGKDDMVVSQKLAKEKAEVERGQTHGCKQPKENHYER